LIVPAHAHSWYPKECCTEKDCHETDSVKELPNGDTEVKVGSDMMTVPHGLKRRKSPDQHYHICYGTLHDSIVIYCFFEPGLS
jgi:hypothetical protein